MTKIRVRYKSGEADDDRSGNHVLLEVDQELAERPRLRACPELADTVGAVEVGQGEDVQELGASRSAGSSRSWAFIDVSARGMSQTTSS